MGNSNTSSNAGANVSMIVINTARLDEETAQLRAEELKTYRVKIPATKGAGDMCKKLKELAEITVKMHDEMQNIIAATIAMLTDVGIEIRLADEKCAGYYTYNGSMHEL